MRILQIASEAVPFVKTGGLADVAGALCRTLAARGHDVALFLPAYRDLRTPRPNPLDTGVRIGGAAIHETRLGSGLRIFLVDAPELFDRPGLYGRDGSDFPDNGLRFATFVRTAVEAWPALGLRPEIVHAHDWQAALAPVYLKSVYADTPAHHGAKTVLTIHNLAFQGAFEPDILASIGLPAELADDSALGHFGRVSFLKGGIRFADAVTTVSPRYAEEIRTDAFGFGLRGALAARREGVTGILNGIDVEVWDPAHDPLIPSHYDVADLSGKRRCKRALQQAFGVARRDDVPLFGMVSRVAEQKGWDLILENADHLASLPAQFVFLGQGEPAREAAIAAWAAGSPNVAARIEYSEGLAHLLEAGSDFYLMPSRFEPCGLNQMISQRYGTPPLVHDVGGLSDSVTHATPEAIDAGRATGIIFRDYDPPALRWAVDFALDLYRRPERLERVMRAGMRAEFSWEASAARYEKLFADVVAAGPRSPAEPDASGPTPPPGTDAPAPTPPPGTDAPDSGGMRARPEPTRRTGRAGGTRAGR